MMAGYPWIYWLVVLIVAGAVSSVLMGIGYLVGLKVAARRVADLRTEFRRDRISYGVVTPTEVRVPLAALPTRRGP